MSVTASTPPPTKIDDGVIKDARRRQARRRRRLGGVMAVLVGVSVVIWAALEGPSKANSDTRPPHRTRVLQIRSVGAPAFNVRLYPATSVGVAGYCEAVEENGRTGGSACGAVASGSEPFTMVYGSGEGARSTTFAVTTPEVASILVNGVRRVTPVAVPGLPYGLRAARIETTKNEPLPPAVREAVRHEGIILVAFNAQGHKLPLDRDSNHRQARVLAWGHPSPLMRLARGISPVLSHAPNGPCQLVVKNLPGLVARAGQVATDIRPFPGELVGEAFLPCVETEYQLGREPIRALVMLNAADPSGRAGNMPNFHPVAGAPGFFGEGGTLTAKRSGNVWLVVGQGSNLHQRMEVLRHLSATVRLGPDHPAAEAGH